MYKVYQVLGSFYHSGSILIEDTQSSKFNLQKDFLDAHWEKKISTKNQEPDYIHAVDISHASKHLWHGNKIQYIQFAGAH